MARKGNQAVRTVSFMMLITLLGKLLGSIQSPIANLARVLNQIAEKGDAGEAPAEAAAEAESN